MIDTDWSGNPIKKCCGEYPNIIKHRNRGGRGRVWWEIRCKKCKNQEVGDGKKQTIGFWNSFVDEQTCKNCLYFKTEPTMEGSMGKLSIKNGICKNDGGPRHGQTVKDVNSCNEYMGEN